MASGNATFLAERDATIMKMRRAGMSHADIARRFDISTAAVGNALKRQLAKMNAEALLAYPEVLRLELERLDALQASVWPLTQHRKVTLPDGTEVQMEPDLKAVAEVRALMAARAKLLGLEHNALTIQVEQNDTPARAALAGVEQAADAQAYTAETQTREFIRLALEAGVLTEDLLTPLLGASADEVLAALPVHAVPDVPDDDDRPITPDEVYP